MCELLRAGTAIHTMPTEHGLPTRAVIYARMRSDPEFRARVDAARDEWCEFAGETIEAIAEAATPDDVACAKLRIDTRKWIMSRRAPKTWGDRVDVGVSGALTINLQRFTGDGDA